MPRKNRSKQQNGGASTDYSALFHSVSADPAQLSRYTLQNISQSPMFNPLDAGRSVIVATPTSGIVVTGAYYDSVAPLTIQNSQGPPVAQYAQLGGRRQHGGTIYFTNKQGKSFTNPWIAHVAKFAEANAINYSQALKHPKVKVGYKKVTKKVAKK
jgi:hypothetical protein